MPDTPVSATAGPLVCGVDFSPESRRALLYSSALAARLGCRLHVVSAVEPLLAEAARTAPPTPRVRRPGGAGPAGIRGSPSARARIACRYDASAGEPAPVAAGGRDANPARG